MIKYDTSAISDDMVESTRKLKEQFGEISSSVNSIVGGISYGQVQTYCNRIASDGRDCVDAYNQLVYCGNNLLSDVESLETRYRGEMEGYAGALAEGLYASQNVFEKAVNELYYKLFQQVLPMNYGYYDTVREKMEAAEVSSHALYLIEEGMIPIWLQRSLEEKMADGKLDAATLDIILDDYHDYENLPTWAQTQMDVCKTDWMDANSDEDKRFAHERAEAIRAQAAIYDTLNTKAQMEIMALYTMYNKMPNSPAKIYFKQFIDNLLIKEQVEGGNSPVDVNLDQESNWIDVNRVSQLTSEYGDVVNSGCAIASMAIVFNAMTGSNLDVDDVYEDQGNTYIAQWYDGVSDVELDGQIKYVTNEYLDQADIFEKAKEAIDDGRPLIIRYTFDYKHKAGGRQHYVVVTGYTGDCSSPEDIFISDPGVSEADFSELNEDGKPYTLQDAYDLSSDKKENFNVDRYVEYDYVD